MSFPAEKGVYLALSIFIKLLSNSLMDWEDSKIVKSTYKVDILYYQ